MTTTIAVTLQRKGRLLVASPAGKAPQLRASTVEKTRQSLTIARNVSTKPDQDHYDK